MQGYNFFFKITIRNVTPTKKKIDDNEYNTQEILISCKTYNLGALGTYFIISSLFVRAGGT